MVAEAGPVEFYISNTSNLSDRDGIKKVLETTAAKLENAVGFTVTKVEIFTKDPNPRTKCWKVTVPYKFRELMENGELYPAGWRYRKLFASRNIRQRPEEQGSQGRQAREGLEAGQEDRQEVNQEHLVTATALQDALKRIAQVEASSLPPAGGSEEVTAQ